MLKSWEVVDQRKEGDGELRAVYQVGGAGVRQFGAGKLPQTDWQIQMMITYLPHLNLIIYQYVHHCPVPQS